MTTPLTLPASTSITLSNIITNLDNTPPSRDTAGQGGGGRSVIVTGVAAVSATLATTAGVRLVRIPSNAIVKSVKVGLDINGLTFTTLTGCLGLVFSDNYLDGTGFNYNNTLQYSCGCFAATTSAGFDFTAAKGNMLDVTYKADLGVSTFTDGIYVPSASNMPIWLAITQGGPGPQTPGVWAGYGATSLSTSPSYHLSADPGGFFDVFFQPTTQNNVSALFQMTCEVSYTTT